MPEPLIRCISRILSNSPKSERRLWQIYNDEPLYVTFAIDSYKMMKLASTIVVHNLEAMIASLQSLENEERGVEGGGMRETHAERNFTF